MARTPLTVAPPGRSVDYDRFLDCIHCGLCLSACPTYEETGAEFDSPRGRIYLMRAVTDGRLEPDDTVRDHLDLCLNCQACETACPSGVRYHQILEPFRDALETQLGPRRRLPAVQRWVLDRVFPYRERSRWALAPMRWLQRTGLDRFLRNRGAERLLPAGVRALHDMLPPLKRHPGRLPAVLPAEGRPRARVALFIGCVADAVFPETNHATARVLQRNGCEVWVPRSQGCCGALHFHNHHGRRAAAFAAANLQAFGFGRSERPEPDAVVVNAAGCGAMLREYPALFRGTEHAEAAAKFAAKVRDVTEFLVERGPVPPTHPIPLTATYHDACHLRHAQGVAAPPRTLLGMIPKLKLVPLEESELCCGAAGSYNLTQPEMAERLGERKARRVLASGAEAVFTGNVGCVLQIARWVRQRRPGFRVAHPADVLWASYSGEPW
jgi:glycolate oxidase iron-sulfur subunit